MYPFVRRSYESTKKHRNVSTQARRKVDVLVKKTNPMFTVY